MSVAIGWPRAVPILARRAFLEAVRGRSAPLTAAVFALLALALSWAGLAPGGVLRFQALSRTALALVSLLLYLVPLLALVQGATALSGSGGWLPMLAAQPVSRAQIVLGEFLGRWAAAAGAVSVGLAAGCSVVWLGAGGDPAALGLLLGLAVLLAGVFTAAGVAAGAASPSRAAALALALGLWFAAVVAYDLAIVGITATVSGPALEPLLLAAAAANPVDAARIVALGAFLGDTLFGATGAAAHRLLGPAGSAALVGAAAAWTAAALTAGIRLFSRREI
ncbi:MAG TPA: ABC transporter permease subunit [Gemmatimonadota bacterium]